MKITKVSALTGIIHTREIPITAAQLVEWDEGGFIPNLSDDEREFLMTGITREELEEALEDGGEWEEDI